MNLDQGWWALRTRRTYSEDLRMRNREGYTALPVLPESDNRANEVCLATQQKAPRYSLRHFVPFALGAVLLLALHSHFSATTFLPPPFLASLTNTPSGPHQPKVGPRRFPSLYHGRGCNSTELIAAVGQARIRKDGASRVEYVQREGMGENELDLSSFTFSYDVEGCPAPHIFSPAEACDLLSAFGGVFTRGDSLMRQFTQGLFILLSNSFAIATDPDRLCMGNSIFTNGKYCKIVSIFNSRELEHVCSEEPFVAYDQIWKFSHEQGVQDKVEHHAGWIKDLLNGYQTFVSSVPANRRRYSPVFVVSNGIHYGWRANATLEMHLLPFLSNTSSANPRPISFFSSYPAVPPNKVEKFAVKQGPERTKRYNAEIRKVLPEISPGELYQGAMHQLEWYNSTDGAVSFDGTHYSYQVAMERAQVFLNVLDTVWGEIVDHGGLID